jgi:hypothetical protein
MLFTIRQFKTWNIYKSKSFWSPIMLCKTVNILGLLLVCWMWWMCIWNLDYESGYGVIVWILTAMSLYDCRFSIWKCLLWVWASWRRCGVIMVKTAYWQCMLHEGDMKSWSYDIIEKSHTKYAIGRFCKIKECIKKLLLNLCICTAENQATLFKVLNESNFIVINK